MDPKTRRENRIKRILGNSENRLKKICSFDGSDQFKDEINNVEEKVVQNTPEFDNHVPSTKPILSNKDSDALSAIRAVLQKEFERETVVDSNAHSDSLEPNFNIGNGALPIIPQNEEVSESPLNSTSVKDSYKRFLTLLLLPCLVHFMFSINIVIEIVSPETVNKIFIPFFLFEILEYTFYKPKLYRTNNIIACLLSSSIPPQVFDIIGVILRVLQDGMVYFFGFVCFDLFFKFTVHLCTKGL